MSQQQTTSPGVAVISWITRFTGYLGGLGVLVLMLHVIADILLRFTVNQTMPGTLEISQYWYLPMAVFLGMAAAYRNDDHISAPIVYEKVSPLVKKEFHTIGALLSIVFLLAMAWWGLEEALTQMRHGATGIGSGVIIWPPRFAVPAGSLLFAAEVTIRLAHEIRSRGVSSVERETTDQEQRSSSDGPQPRQNQGVEGGTR